MRLYDHLRNERKENRTITYDQETFLLELEAWAGASTTADEDARNIDEFIGVFKNVTQQQAAEEAEVAS